VFLEERVGINHADEPVPGCVQAGIDRVRLAAVDLVDDEELAVRQRSIDAADRLCRQRALVRDFRTDEIEGIDQGVQRPVSGSIVDDDDLVLRIVQEQERAQALADRGLFVVGGHDEGDRRGGGRSYDHVEIPRRPAPPVASELDECDDREHQIERVERHEIDDERPLERDHELRQHVMEHD
jgi:hypothetical protein